MTLTEQEAREAAAEHSYIEATSHGDKERRFLCIYCGKELRLPLENPTPEQHPSDGA